ncbi:MAG: TonB-dependent receptor [Niabella sp.]
MRNYYIKRIVVFCVCMGVFLAIHAQEKVLRGIIKNEENQPIPYLTIHVKHKKDLVTSTDSLGRFYLNTRGLVNLGDTLIFSSVNYGENEYLVNSFEPINITLKAVVKTTDGGDDLVVIGYARQKRITLTGSVSTVTGTELRQSPASNLQNALAGRLPGLFSQQRSGQPGADAATLSIRGTTSYTNSATPLFIVDDVVFDYNQFQQIDANEVESISILKDASTTAIYGVAGANGVIILTTRRGQAGKPSLNFRNEYGLQYATRMPKVNDGYTTLLLLKEYLTLQGLDPAVQYPTFFAGNNLNYYKDNSDPYGHPNVNWWDVLMRDQAPQYRSNLDISGGSKIVKYFISLGYLSQAGIYKDFWKDLDYNGNYFYDRYNFRSNIDIDPTSTLKIRLDLSGRFGQTNEPNDKSWNNGGTTFQYLWNGELSSFVFPVYNPDGSFGGTSNTTTYKPNPVANLMYSGYNRKYNNDFNAVLSATQQLDFVTKGLSAKALLSYSSGYTYYRSLTRSSSEIPTFIYDASSGTYTPATTNLYYLGNLSRSSYTYATNYIQNIQLQLNYGRSYGKHNLSGLFLINPVVSQTSSYSSYLVPAAPIKTRGYTVRASYNYNQKYLFDYSMAYNGSDQFGDGKKYGYFPAVGVGWNISNEKFFKENIQFIDYLKLKGSYGLVGYDKITGYDFLYTQTYSTGKTYNFGEVSTNYSGLYEGTLGNDQITWEKEKKLDIGIETKVLNNKLSISADYFINERFDILTTRGTIPSILGVGLPPVNLGKTRSAGYEVELKYDGKAGNVKYWLSGQVTYSRNKILYMDEAPAKYPWLAKTGHSIGAIFGYTWTGEYYKDINDLQNSPLPSSAVVMKNMFPGGLKLKDLNDDGVLDENDMGYLGVNLPQYTSGLSFGISYKGLDISLMFQGAFDYVINIQRGSLSYSRPDRVSSPFNLNRWTPENADNATYPSLAPSLTNSYTSSFWYRKGDYIRFKNFEIGYTIPKPWSDRVHLKNARIYANGYNIGLVWTALPVQIDPESAASSSAGEYPQQRIINFGLQVGL